MPHPRKIKGIVSREELYDLYVNQKLSIPKLAQRFGVCEESVRQLMIDYGIPRRTLAETASLLSPKKVNENFFSEWSNEMAYILGIIVTDGSLDDKTRDLRISLTDHDLVFKMAEAMGLENGVQIITRKCSPTPQAMLSIARKQIFDDLLRLGVFLSRNHDKTFNQTFPNVPPEYRNHFIRGLFDGDGSIVIRRRTPNNLSKEMMIVNASLDLIEDLAAAVEEDIGVKGRIAYHVKPSETKKAVYRYGIFTRDDVDRFGDYIYKDAGNLYLKRKKDRFDVKKEEIA